MSFDARDHFEHGPSAISTDPDWYTRNDEDVTPVATVKAWARAMRLVQKAHDEAELGVRKVA